jgi:hypothetical protein
VKFAKIAKSEGETVMNENRISIEFTQVDIDAVNEAIATLAAKLQPMLIALDAADKRNLAKLGEKSVSFVGKSLQYAVSNPEFLPAFVDVVEMQKDFTAFNLLNGFLRPLEQITKNLDDTATLCGSETIQASLAYYNSTRQAVKMNVPKASAIYDDLSQRFEAQKARKIKSGTVK